MNHYSRPVTENRAEILSAKDKHTQVESQEFPSRSLALEPRNLAMVTY